MAQDLETAIGGIIAKIEAYVGDVAQLTVSTYGMDVDPAAPSTDWTQSRAIARTVVKADGDTTVTLPVRAIDGALVADAALFDLHERSVRSATEYRTQVLAALVGALQTLGRTG
jgi:hypothetical protein